MLAKKHENIVGSVLAVCDKEHLGKTYEDEKICFTVSEKFYSGEKVTKKQLLELIAEFSSVNMFGNKCVEIAEKEGLISETSIIKVKGIKHAQIYKM
ncbi:MAG: DUF424 family protein [archaeon]